LALVDERGRVFGRVNLIDLLVGVFCLLLIPLAYGAFVLFRTAPPAITSVTPATVTAGSQARVVVTGRGLRPFLAANVGPRRADFYVASETLAELEVPDLPVGTYELLLSDDQLTVARVPGAITIVAPPPPPGIAVQVSGTFNGVSEAVAKTLTAGARFPAGTGEPAVEILAARPAEPLVVRLPAAAGVIERPVPGLVRVPAIVRIRCAPVGETCRAGDTVVAAGATIQVAAGRSLPFHVLDVSDADTAPLFAPDAFKQTFEVEARLLTSPETLPRLAAGASDIDRRIFARESASPPAVLLRFRRVAEVEARTVTDWFGLDVKTSFQLHQIPRPLAVVDATFSVPVQRTADGWEYKGTAVKLGAPIFFEGPFYTLRGWILGVTARKP
jgi:hypothetical protein